jgi:hypothetical protein
MSRLRRNPLGHVLRVCPLHLGSPPGQPLHAIRGMDPGHTAAPPAIQGGWRLQIEGVYTSALGSLTALLSMGETGAESNHGISVVGRKCWLRSNEAHSAFRLRCGRPAGVVGRDGGLRYPSHMNTSRNVQDGGSRGAHVAEICDIASML